ncbi:C13 family peptidase [Pseudomonas turukhanskensis]|uniref:Peptidase C13 n=1 Tax=Pseudomonas turukhanskensis TaxID=1806536 RepID=A0A9W6KBS2_9PSED|nr:C13 family peptidase [Pseudomonas turukhanskensis]GLK91818.1 peptidase C13 [Pseudomonas turukhanskensis]
MRRLSLLALALLLAACGKGEPITPPNAVLPDGGRFRGEVVDGLLQGKGRIDYPNGSWYEGSFKDGQMEGQGELHHADGTHYVGSFAAGDFGGQGTLTYSEGSRYEGGFKAGLKDGVGKLQIKGGDTYQGEFKADLYHGIGKLQRADGSSFEGSFSKGEPQGFGTTTDENGNQLSGTFKKGKLDGEGTYKSNDGDSYVGTYKNSNFDGKGRYQTADGDTWLGQFSKGSLTGKGQLDRADGSHYEGDFRYWRYHGEGLLKLADGSHYQGHFAHGEYDGIGTLTAADGSVKTGTWKKGALVRDAQGNALPDPLEVGLLEQGKLLDQALAAVPASTPAVELYTLTLAGDGEQSVFLREADYVTTLLRERFGAHGQITLVNHRDHMLDRPLATRENLRRAAKVLAERAGPEDMVFVYLTSHGSRDHQLSLVQPGLELANMPASELAELLLPLKSHYKVVVVSACFSGGFIPQLKDDKTLVMTAARSDRTSFGCSDEADFTYFGRALFAEALSTTDDLERAFEQAKASVAKREQEDDFEPSEPQIWAPKGVLTQWRTFRESQAKRALTASAGNKAASSN